MKRALDRTVKVKRRSAGRPPQTAAPVLLEAILKAALQVFVSKGFSAATMREIAAEARVSPQTLYARFHDKTELYEALMQKRTNSLLGAMSGLLQEAAPPQEALQAFGVILLTTFLGTELRRLQQMVIAEANTFPELAATFYYAGPDRGRTLLTAYLHQCVERRELSIGNIGMAAEQFIGSLVGGIVIRSTLAQPLNLSSEDEIRTWVSSAVQMFLRAYKGERAPETARSI